MAVADTEIEPLPLEETVDAPVQVRARRIEDVLKPVTSTLPEAVAKLELAGPPASVRVNEVVTRCAAGTVVAVVVGDDVVGDDVVVGAELVVVIGPVGDDAIVVGAIDVVVVGDGGVVTRCFFVGPNGNFDCNFHERTSFDASMRQAKRPVIFDRETTKDVEPL